MTAALGAARAASGATRRASGAATKGSARAGARGGTRSALAEQQAAGIQAIKDRRPKDRAPAEGHVLAEVPIDQPAEEAAPPAPRQPVEIPGARVANTGGGFILGVGAWILVRTYLDGGGPAVKKLLKAKFFNEVAA